MAKSLSCPKYSEITEFYISYMEANKSDNKSRDN